MTEDIAEPVQIEDRVQHGVLGQLAAVCHGVLHDGQQRLHLQLADFPHRPLQLNMVRNLGDEQGCGKETHSFLVLSQSESGSSFKNFVKNYRYLMKSLLQLKQTKKDCT